MLRHLLAVVAIGATSVAQAPSSDVAIGVFPFLVGNMDARSSEIANNCVLHGIDTVYVSAFRTTGPMTGQLWVTDSAGDWNPAWGSVRPGGAGIDLVALVAACRAVDVRVVPVLKCFDASVQPDHAAHRQFLLEVVDYFIDAFDGNGEPVYDIDGIALDYVRYVGSGNANAQLVTDFVADVAQRIGGLSLHAYLLAGRYTFDGPVYNGQWNSYGSVIAANAQQYGQHWEQLAAHVDVMMPMAYTADGSIYNSYALHQAYVQQTAAYARTACQIANHPCRRVCPVVRTYTGSGETCTTQTVDASVTGALLGGGDGYQSFRYQHVVNNPAWWTPLATHAVPGCNWPVPSVVVSPNRLTAGVDPTASRDADQPAATLQVRFDIDGDGAFDTAWLPNAPIAELTRHPGTWDLTAQVQDADGHISATRRRYLTGSAVTLAPATLGASLGGTVLVKLDVGPAGAGHVYLALASLAGTAPGFVWQPGFPVPLNIDFLTTSLAANPNGGFVSHGLGVFTANGRATAQLVLPAGAAVPFAWSTVHWNFVALSPSGLPSCVGNSQPMLILP